MIDYGKRTVLGVHVDAVDVEAAVERIAFFARRRRSYAVTALAVHGVVEATKDPHLRAALRDFDLVVPDGQPVRWALNLLHSLDLPEKVPGPTIVDRLLEIAAAERIPALLASWYDVPLPAAVAASARDTRERAAGGASVRGHS